MAGLLYLPRLFVYHAETINNEDKKDTFKLMEKRLFFYIMNPAMILSWLFGVLLIHSIGVESFSQLWFQLKLVMVLFLTGYHFFLLYCLNSFHQNKIANSGFRIHERITPQTMNTIRDFILRHTQRNTAFKVIHRIMQVDAFNPNITGVFSITNHFYLVVGQLFQNDPGIYLKIVTYFFQNIRLWKGMATHIPIELYAVNIQITTNGRHRRPTGT